MVLAHLRCDGGRAPPFNLPVRRSLVRKGNRAATLCLAFGLALRPSARLPAETNVEIPRPRFFAVASRAVPSATEKITPLMIAVEKGLRLAARCLLRFLRLREHLCSLGLHALHAARALHTHEGAG